MEETPIMLDDLFTVLGWIVAALSVVIAASAFARNANKDHDTDTIERAEMLVTQRAIMGDLAEMKALQKENNTTLRNVEVQTAKNTAAIASAHRRIDSIETGDLSKRRSD